MQQIGEGRCADILALSDSLVLKLYQPRFDRDWVERSAAIGTSVAEAGISSPAIHAVESHDDRHGIVMDRLDGGTMFDALIAAPERVQQIGAALARLHQQIHSVYIEGLESRSAALVGRIGDADLTPEVRQEAFGRLEDLSTDSIVLGHGDLHPANVMMSAGGEPIAIDWDGAMNGPRAYDVTRAYLLLDRWALAPGDFDKDVVERHRKELANAYLDTYLDETDLDRTDVEAWVLPAEAARRCEPVPEEDAERAKGVRRTL